MKRKVKLTTRHGLHWTLDKGVRVALQALTHKARATFDGFAAGRKPGLPDTGQMSAEQIIENLRGVESMAGSLASQMETNLRMNRWREHLGDDPLDGFGGRGPAEYHYMATHEPEGPGLTRFGNLQLPDDPGSRKASRLQEIARKTPAISFADRPTQPQPRGEARCNECGKLASTCDCGMDSEGRFDQPRGEADDLAARLEARADNADKMAAEVARNPSNYGESGPRHHARLLAAAYAFRKAAEMARASTHPEQWVSGDDREWLLWITSYVLNRHEFTDSAATDARAALTRIATAIKQPASPTPTEQGEDRTRVEWHDGIEHGDELALRQLAADIGCGIPYGCQPSVGKWYAAALDRVLDRLLPLDPAPEQGEARFAADPAPPRGEGGDLAARTVQIIRNRAKIAREQGTTEAQIIRARALDEAANEFADILPALRASTHPEQGETRAFERGVREACRLMRHVDTLDKVPGARDGLPHLNPLWDGSAYVEDALVGPFADRIQRPAPEGEGEPS